MVGLSSGSLDFEEIRSKCPAEVLDQVLSFFGISESKDQDGKSNWSISIDTAPPYMISRKAIFNERHGKWRLKQVVSPADTMGSNTVPMERYYPMLHISKPQNPLITARPFGSESWITNLPKDSHAEFFLSVDWPSTDLGDINNWPLSLRLYTHMMLSDRRASVIYWGKNKTALYNAQFCPLLGNAHPSFMGSTFSITWPEVWNKFQVIFKEIEETGVGVTLDDYPLLLDRNGYIEETWWTGDLFALRDETGDVNGAYFSWNENTSRVLFERRMKLVDDIGKPPSQKVEEIWDHICNILERNPLDVAMAMLYSAEDSADTEHVLKRRGIIGVRPDHPAAPESFDLNTEMAGFAPALRKSKQNQEGWIALDQSDDLFPKEILSGVDWKGYLEPSTTIVVMPLFVFDILKGTLVIGLNPRRELDSNHRTFISELSRQLKAVMTTITTVEQARQREARLMRELQDSEKRVRTVGQAAPMGLYELSVEGPLMWANDHFFDIVGAPHARNDLSKFSWEECILEEDQPLAQNEMVRSVMEHVDISDTLRLKRKWRPPPGPDGDVQEENVYILYKATPSVQNGQVVSFMGCIVDVSKLKWAETLQARIAEAAQLAKRRQEEFIDITSHEMRNPLSAITQCADGIVTAYEEAEQVKDDSEALMQLFKANAEMGESILACASHQRRIIDDVLTLSKLDSALLHITPACFRPRSILNEAMQMFNAEFGSADIFVQVIEESLDAMTVDDPVFCDPSRLMQVLVNLITNAIKFTRTEETRHIVIRYGATAHPVPPEQFGKNFRWCPTGQNRRDLTEDADYGRASHVYLYYSVEDTGQGLPARKAAGIFDKFIQASRRTHIKYGGSGLGLFISRELTEMQSGQIGVGSEECVGSTFAFYVKGRCGDVSSLPSIPKSSSHTRGGSRNQCSPVRAGTKSLLEGPVQRTQSPLAGAPPHSGTSSLPIRPRSRSRSPRPSYDILLVEDNLVNQTVLAKQLRKAGCTVAVANHGGEAIDFLLRLYGHPPEYGLTRTSTNSPVYPPSTPTSSTTMLGSPLNPADHHPSSSYNHPPHHPLHHHSHHHYQPPPPSPKDKIDCILMDWEMPVVDGLAATKRIRQLEKEGIIPTCQLVMGVTANARSEQIRMAREAGMDEVLPKPFRVPELLKKIEGVMMGE